MARTDDEALRLRMCAALGDTLPRVLWEVIDAYAAFHAVILYRAAGVPLQRVRAEGEPTSVHGVDEEGREPVLAHAADARLAFVCAADAPGRHMRSEATLCLADAGRSAYAVCTQPGDTLHIKVCDISAVNDRQRQAAAATSLVWKEIATPPPQPPPMPNLLRFHFYHLYTLDDRLFLFDLGTNPRVWEYEFATEAWGASDETREMAERSHIALSRHCVAAGSVLYSFAQNGTCYAFDRGTCKWRSLFDCRRIYPTYRREPAPLALPRNGLLFMQTGQANLGILQAARYLGDDGCASAVCDTDGDARAVGGMDGDACAACDTEGDARDVGGMDGGVSAVDLADGGTSAVGGSRTTDAGVNAAGSRWLRVLWNVPRSVDGSTQFESCWLDPYSERLYVMIAHRDSNGGRRLYVLHRSLRLSADATSSPLDFYAQSSVGAWTVAATHDTAASERPCEFTAFSTAPAPHHAADHVFSSPPSSFGPLLHTIL